ncbi:unnamed protein product [Chrysoparadoxa australica]
MSRALAKGGLDLSEEDLALLVKKFGRKGEEGEEEVGYQPLVKWLETGVGLDNKSLHKIQRHVRARLNKAYDLRSMFLELSKGKKTLGRKPLAKGFKQVGLKLSDDVVDELLSTFARRKKGYLVFDEFHRMINTKDLRDVSPHPGSGDVTPSATETILDDHLYMAIMSALEKAFAFYDVDGSSSIDVNELDTIVRAMGHDPTKKELRAIMRKADADRNGVLKFDEFQEALMPFLMERLNNKHLTEAEIRNSFTMADANGSGTISRQEFKFTFVKTLGLLTEGESEAIMHLVDRNEDGKICWSEFKMLFELIKDQEGATSRLIKPEVKEVLLVALKKLQIGVQPDPEEHLMAFMGMPSNYRKSILSRLDNIDEYSLKYLMVPQLDSRGGILLPDMSVKVTTEVNESTGLASAPQKGVTELVSGLKTTGKKASASKAKSSSKQSLKNSDSQGGLGDHVLGSSTKQVKQTRRRSSILSMGGTSDTVTTIVKKSAALQPAAQGEDDSVMQVCISIKRGTGIPVPDDSRVRDVLQRSMRASLFYQQPKDVDRDLGTTGSNYEDYFLGNTYKTLAKQDPNREEVWLFPSSDDSDRKFLVRTDFDDPSEKGESACIHLLVELTCTLRTEREKAIFQDDKINGPLKQFKVSSNERWREIHALRNASVSMHEASSDEEEEAEDSSEESESESDEGEGQRGKRSCRLLQATSALIACNPNPSANLSILHAQSRGKKRKKQRRKETQKAKKPKKLHKGKKNDKKKKQGAQTTRGSVRGSTTDSDQDSRGEEAAPLATNHPYHPATACFSPSPGRAPRLT